MLRQISPRALLFGHTASITCVAKARDFEKKPYVVSAASNGNEMSLWNVSSGQCVENTKMTFTHTSICEKQLIFEMESKSLQCLMCQTIRFCKYTERLLLVVCSDSWKVYDYCDFSLLCMELSKTGQGFTGGELLPANRLLVWTEDGHSYIYQLSDREFRLFFCVLEIQVAVTCSLADSFKQHVSEEIVGPLSCPGDESPAITVSVYIPNNDQLVCGCEDGKIIVMAALRVARAKLLEDRSQLRDWLSHKTVQGHSGRVTCLLYPYNKSVSFNPSWLVSGGQDSCVVWWDVFTGEILHKFTLQAGPVVNLSVPPEECRVYDYCDFSLLCMELSKTGQGFTGGELLPANRLLVWTEDGHSYIYQLSDRGLLKHVIYPPCESSASETVSPRMLCCTSDRKTGSLTRLSKATVEVVTCLLYPYNKSMSFNPSWLVSGGQDSCVVWWDVFTGEILHIFTLQAGPVVNLSVPPEECRPKVHQSVCCLASDQSIALLNLQEQACIIHARKHLFSVKIIKWRPVEDFLVVGCEDGSVYVWEIESGALERHETGDAAKAILSSCDDSQAVLIDTWVPIPAGARPNHLHQRNHLHCKATSSFKHNTLAATNIQADRTQEKVGALERHETGDAAKAILSSCDDSQAVLIDTWVPIPAGARPNHLHQRNHLHCKATSSFKHNTLAATNIQADRTQEKVPIPELILSPFTVLQLKATSVDNGFHVLTFDVEGLLEQLHPSPEERQVENKFCQITIICGLHVSGICCLFLLLLKPFIVKDAARYPLRGTESLKKLITSWQQQSVEVLEAVQAVLLVEVQRIIKTLRKTSISSQAVTVAVNRNGETQTLPKIGGTELLESQQSTAPRSTIEESSILQLSEKAPHSEAPAETVDVPKCVEHTGNPPDPHQNITATCIQQQCLKQRARKSNITVQFRKYSLFKKKGITATFY
ncbi:UNVERIFIED_CONTAM: hypothetical protein FKN15_028906 [Acipenser sinensis]